MTTMVLVLASKLQCTIYLQLSADNPGHSVSVLLGFAHRLTEPSTLCSESQIRNNASS